MNRITYGVVIPARNEESSIKYTIRSLKRQYLKPEYIIVVDDGSRDNTSDIARKEGCYVIQLSRITKANATGTPYLAYVINQGLKELEALDLDYVLISGAEAIYPENYVWDLVTRIHGSRIVIASGMAKNELIYGVLSVRGSGRIINARWFKEVGFRYPLNYGFETWLLLKAFATGYKARVYKDISFFLLRKTSMNPRKAYFYGKAMKALSYPTIYALLKALKTGFLNEPKDMVYMLSGYYSNLINVYDDIKNTTRYILVKEFLRRMLIREG